MTCIKPTSSITALNHTTLAVCDLETSFHFYRHVLELKSLVKWHAGAYFLAGDHWFCLNVNNKRQPTDCYTHYAFSVTPAAFDWLHKKIGK